VKAITIRLAVLLIAGLFVVLLGQSVHAQFQYVVCSKGWAPDMEEEHDAWGWATCFDWIAWSEMGGSFYWQSYIVDYTICRDEYPWKAHCDQCDPPWNECDDYAPGTAHVMPAMRQLGFDIEPRRPAPWYCIPPVLGGEAPLCNEIPETICGGCYLYCIFESDLNLTTGRTGVLHTIRSDPAGFFNDFSTVKVMNPGSGENEELHILSSFFRGGTNDFSGDWLEYWPVCGLEPTTVGIGDIGGFWYESQDAFSLGVGYRIQDVADPADSAAVYIADNSAGPARLIRDSVRIPAIEPETNSFYDDLIYYIDDYYYCLNHGPGPFPETMQPAELCSNTDYPILFDGNGHEL
jgi:hypothetical protein